MADPARFDLQTGFDLAGAGLADVHLRYVVFGGSEGRDAVGDIIAGRAAGTSLDRNRIAQALNELFLDRGVDTFPVAYVESADAPGDALASEARASATRTREYAAHARRRGRTIARQAAELHASAAELMQASGQLLYAREARRRAATARERAGSAPG